MSRAAAPAHSASSTARLAAEIGVLVAMSFAFGVIGRFLLAHIERVGRVGGKLLTRAD